MKKRMSFFLVGILTISMAGCVQNGNRHRQEDISVGDGRVVSEESEQTKEADSLSEPPQKTGNAAERDVPAVYMTTDISPDGLMAVYEALGASPTGQIAIKLSTGESENSNHLRPELIGDFVRSFDDPTIDYNRYVKENKSNADYVFRQHHEQVIEGLEKTKDVISQIFGD